MPHQCTNCGHTFPDGSKEMLSGCPDCGGNKFQFHPDAVPDDPPGDDAAPGPDRPAESGGVAERVGRAASTVRDLVGDSTPGAGAPEEVGPDVTVDADSRATEGTASDRAHGEWPDADRPRRDDATTDAEDRAQADARSEVVAPDTLPDSDETTIDADGAATADAEAPTDGPEDAPRPEDDTMLGQAEADVDDQTEGDADDQTEADADDQAEADADDQTEGDVDGLSELREELNDQFESIRVVAPGQYELNLMELYDREEYIIALQENGRYVIEVPDTWRDDE